MTSTRVGAARRWLVRHAPVVVPLAVGLASFGVASAVLAWAAHDRPVLRLQVAFESGACCSWQVWINGASTGDLTVLPLNARSDMVYTVPVYRPQINRLFVTVGSQAGGTAEVKRIWVTRGSTTVAEVSPTQLSGATVYNATGAPTRTGLRLRATGVQPAIDLPVSLATGEGAVRAFLARLTSQRVITFAAMVVLGSILLTFLAVQRRTQWWLIAGVLGVTIIGVRGMPWLSWQLHFHDDVGHAVGYATYVGRWKDRERFILEGASALAVAAAAFFGIFHLRRRTSIAVEHGILPPSDRPLPRWAPPLLVTAPIAVVALQAVPNLRLYIGEAPQHVPSWDANNFVFWQYLIESKHLAAMKDFFWPYGFQWLFDEAAPWGLLISYGWFLTFWIFLALGTYLSLSRFFAGRSLLIRYVVLTGLWLTAALTTDVPFQTRYVAPLAVVLLYAGIDRRSASWSWKPLVFAVALLDTALFEPAQALYALAPIVVITLIEFATDVVRAQGERLSWLVRAIAPTVVPLAAAALVYTIYGAAGPMVSFYEAQAVAWSEYAFPSAVDDWVTRPTTLESFIFWAVPLTLALGTIGAFLRRGRLRQSYSVVVGLGVLGLMIMQKQILRPHGATQMWFVLVFGLAYWATIDTLLPPIRRWPLVLGAAGAFAALALVSGGYATGWDAVAGAPTRIQGSVHALVYQRATFAAQARRYFAPSTFVNFSDYQPVVRALQQTPSVERGGSVWVLGDDTAITMMLGKSWPYYYNDMYDASPIDFQKAILARLARHPPARVVWNFRPTSMIYDSVPTPVRVPLLYEWAVTRLTPERTIGQFAILRLRRPYEPVALGWWRRRIGTTVNLGHIPAASHLPTKACGGTNCSTYLTVKYDRETSKQPTTTVPIEVGGLPFAVSFEPGPESRYVIRLDRVWFWAAGAGASRKVKTTSTGGPTVSVVQRSSDPDSLY